MIVERDTYGQFHVRGTSNDGQDGWGIKVWREGSNQEGPEDKRFRVINGQFFNWASESASPHFPDGISYKLSPISNLEARRGRSAGAHCPMGRQIAPDGGVTYPEPALIIQA